jgi:F0F1-type ATP synthase assembly protein I
MMERVGQLIDAATDLAKARAALIIHDAQRAGGRLVMFVLGAGVAAMGCGVLLAACAIVLAERFGWAASLGIIGGALLAMGAGIMLMYRSSRRSAEESRAQAERDVRASLDAVRAATESQASANGQAREQGGLPTALLTTLLQDRQILASGIFAAISILGARRSLKILGLVTSGAGIAASMAQTWRSLSSVHGDLQGRGGGSGGSATQAGGNGVAGTRLHL